MTNKITIDPFERHIENLDPYIGPRPFERHIEDQIRFFGRDYETQEIISLIFSHSVVLIYGQSGAGKTSIFNAKVAPILEKYGFQVLPTARVGISSYIASLKQYCIEINYEIDKFQNKIKNVYMFNAYHSIIPEELNIDSFAYKSLNEFLNNCLPTIEKTDLKKKNGIDVPQVLVFDQFEELFTSCIPDQNWKAEREGFFRQVSEALEERPMLCVVFIMREEYLAQLDPFIWILPERLRPRFRLENLRKDAAIEAIKEPLKITRSRRLFLERNIRQEDLDKIIDSTVTSLLKIRVEDPTSANPNKISIVEGEYVEPIQLQVVCQRRFSEWDPEKKENRDQSRAHKLNWLRLKWFRLYPQEDDEDQAQTDKESEDVERALREFYEEAINRASEETGIDEKDIRRLFEKKFIATTGTRYFVNRDDIIQVIYHRKDSQSFIHRLYHGLYNRYKQSFIYRLSNLLHNWQGVVKKYWTGERIGHYSHLDVSRQRRKGKTEEKNKEDVLLNSLRESYVVKGQRIGGAIWYELTHDRLIGPIKDSNESWYKQRSWKAKLTSSPFIS